MNKADFYQYLQFPELLDERSINNLEKVVAQFPYFQTARLLLLKNLNNQGSIKYYQELKRTAIWINNRRKLFFLLDKRVLLPVNALDENFTKAKAQEQLSNEIVDFSELSSHTAFTFIDETDNPNDELEQLIMTGAAQASTFFNVDDHVDLEDFKNTFKKNKDTHETDPEKSKAKRENLIDKFIVEQPKIITENKNNETLSVPNHNSDKENPDMITDTLARIYVKQGLYEKAISAYEKLSLKYPEKNSYFASQIKKIKDIINNQ